MKRSVLAVLTALVASVALPGGAVGQGREVPVTFVTTIDGRAAWVYVGIHDGFFSREGMTVKLTRGQGSEPSGIGVDQGRFAFAVNVDFSSIVTLRNRGGGVKGIMVLNALSPLGVSAFAGRLRTPKDLEGTTIGLQPGTGGARMFPIFAGMNHIDLNKVKSVPLAQDVYVSAFLSGRIDVISVFTDAIYQVVRIQAEKQGKRLDSLWYSDWNVDTYGGVIVTSERLLKENPDLVRRFLRAAQTARTVAMAEPERAIQVMNSYLPELDPTIALAQWKDHTQHAREPSATPGCAISAKVQRSIDIYREAFGIADPMRAADAFTNDYMAWCHAPR